MFLASSTDIPFAIVVIKELDAMADPHPNVLNLASSIIPLSLILSCSFITSPQAGAPARPVPTEESDLSKLPIFLGFSK